MPDDPNANEQQKPDSQSETPKPGPKPGEQQQKQDDQKPWGEEFDAQRAWNLTENLRGDKSKLQQQNADLQAQIEQMRREGMNAEQQAAADAIEAAKKEARSEAEAQWRPKYQESQFRGIASSVIKSPEQLESFLAVTDPSKFVGEDGDIDREKVMGHLTAIFVAGQQAPAPRQWGQHSGNGGPPEKAGDAGRAALAKRHGVKQSS